MNKKEYEAVKKQIDQLAYSKSHIRQIIKELEEKEVQDIKTIMLTEIYKYKLKVWISPNSWWRIKKDRKNG